MKSYDFLVEETPDDVWPDAFFIKAMEEQVFVLHRWTSKGFRCLRTSWNMLVELRKDGIQLQRDEDETLDFLLAMAKAP